jgi:small subunit ribosomal protein S17
MPKKRIEGIVVSTINDKTVKVSAERIKVHAFYGKRMKETKSYLAHDEENTLKIGDKVIIEETRPISKRKTWIVIK